MNWGKAVIIAFILFATFVLTIVYKSTTQRVDLVRDDYYKEELNYQKHIDLLAKSKKYDSTTTFNYTAERQEIEISLPNIAQKAEVSFFRPSNKSMDFSKTLDKFQSYILSTKELTKGRWKIQLRWSDGKEDFMKEEDVFIQ